ncbi:MAG: hypothetical protein M0P74_13890 [Syntrophales bacterium]|jgi:hypothetical protein|nr:hypothetical protein [Syntrophales bacterium]
MQDYWIKISESEDEGIKYHHFLITAQNQAEARKFAMAFIERFIDDDENPEAMENGYSFYNKAVFVRLVSIKETTKETFKNFLLKLHTINMG